MHDLPIYPTTKQILFAGSGTGLALVVMAVLRWLGLPAGELVDWLVAIAGFWWLLGVTTVPWNLYFGARAVQGEIVLSRKRGLTIELADATFVGRTARRSLGVAIVLHLVSAVGFAALAWSGLTAVGWFAAAAAVLLTLFRPAVRLYRHVATTLWAIGKRARYPRDDVREARESLERHAARLSAVERALSLKVADSWASDIEQRLARGAQDRHALGIQLEAAVDANETAHRRLARDAERIGERLGEDSAFLGNVREIIRFVKDA